METERARPSLQHVTNRVFKTQSLLPLAGRRVTRDPSDPTTGSGPKRTSDRQESRDDSRDTFPPLVYPLSSGPSRAGAGEGAGARVAGWGGVSGTWTRGRTTSYRCRWATRWGHRSTRPVCSAGCPRSSPSPHVHPRPPWGWGWVGRMVEPLCPPRGSNDPNLTLRRYSGTRPPGSGGGVFRTWRSCLHHSSWADSLPRSQKDPWCRPGVFPSIHVS